jgi:hypothetical protein
MAASSRRLGPVEITLIVVDVVLIGVLIFLLATAPEGPDDAGEATATTSTAVDGEDPDDAETTSSGPVVTVPAGAVEVAEFASPTGNIWCNIAADAATCQIETIEYEQPAIADCAENELSGHVITVSAEGSAWVCPEGDIAGPAPGDRTVLEYDQTSRVGDYFCTSTEQGMSCTNITNGAGFSVRRAEVELY